MPLPASALPIMDLFVTDDCARAPSDDERRRLALGDSCLDRLLVTADNPHADADASPLAPGYRQRASAMISDGSLADNAIRDLAFKQPLFGVGRHLRSEAKWAALLAARVHHRAAGAQDHPHDAAPAMFTSLPFALVGVASPLTRYDLALSYLLEAGLDPDLVGPPGPHRLNGHSLLICSVLSGRAQATARLLAAGATPDLCASGTVDLGGCQLDQPTPLALAEARGAGDCAALIRAALAHCAIIHAMRSHRPACRAFHGEPT